MSYRVLARTYRSNTFDEVVGQDAIATTLKNAIASGRVHHGYLFTGTRGVGKTSMARILAKALNCLSANAPTTTPCCKCESCRAIATGEDIDVVEIDAASNTGVDNIRELRSNATLRPARARFKVYIIDEVHMLSTGAFNALLKTLEEPPPHVKFILATTEIQKVPATIQSRCQRFDFRAVEARIIAEHLRRIAEKEGVQAEESVLRRIARLASGSVRDALSLLDKLLSYGPEGLTAAALDELIPPPHDELTFAIFESVAKRDAAGTLKALDRALQSGRTVDRFCDHLIDHLRTLMLIRVCGQDTDLVDIAGPMGAKVAEQAGSFDGPTYVYMITLLEELRRNVKSSGAARALADAAMVRLAMSEQFSDIPDLLARLGGDGEESAPIASSAPAVSKKNDAASGTTTSPVTQAVAEARAAPSGVAGRPGQRTAYRSDVRTPPVQTSADWERAARDPFVLRVKEAVDGTISDVRPAAQQGHAKPASAESDDEDQPTQLLPFAE
jgi:DNA polymerase-3 subunit gamma/tau